MIKTAIIIPSRLDSKRLPNKPLELIKGKEMILHVYEAAKKASSGEVFVATPDKKIINIIEESGGKAVQTSESHQTGTDRVFEVFDKLLYRNPDIVVNLQGDMPNIQPQAIKDLIFYMEQGKCDIGTLASNLNSKSELEDQNIVKVLVKEKMIFGKFSRAIDFSRIKPDKRYNIYHHIGIYAFTNKALIRYVGLKRSKLELDRNLEQLRAIENNMSIHVGYIRSSPLSVDTNKDLIRIREIMDENE
tara:strand:- start:781 stop:1518 length:738 start_codon:yes stop_codon:yes gene_type:complete